MYKKETIQRLKHIRDNISRQNGTLNRDIGAINKAIKIVSRNSYELDLFSAFVSGVVFTEIMFLIWG